MFKLNLDSRKIVSIFDDAIDHDESDVSGYVEAGYPEDWSSYLVMKDEEPPTLWEIEGLTWDTRERIGRMTKMVQRKNTATVSLDKGPRLVEAFRCGVVGWENLPIEYSRRKGGVDPSRMEKLARGGPKVVYEIGKVILDGSSLDDDEKN